jgi:hypothetical protein
MVGVTVLIAKHSELSLDEMYAVYVFYFKLLPVCK